MIPLRSLYRDWPSSKGVDIGFGHLEEILPDFNVDFDPDYQRGHVWTPAQRSAFAAHAITGGKILPLFMNDLGREDGRLEIIDGKQRLSTVLAWLRGEIPADLAGRQIFIHQTDRRFRIGYGFRLEIVRLPRVEVLRFYLRLNRGGTPHTPEQLAKVDRLLAEEEARLAAHP